MNFLFIYTSIIEKNELECQNHMYKKKMKTNKIITYTFISNYSYFNLPV